MLLCIGCASQRHLLLLRLLWLSQHAPIQPLRTAQVPLLPLGRGVSIGDPAAWLARHPLQLCSAALAVLGQELDWTTCHGAFIGTVDFIWFTPLVPGGYSCRAEGVLLPPPLTSLPCGLPSADFSSDHVAVGCDFVIERC